MRKITLLVLILGIAGSVRAQDAALATDAKLIAPYLDSQTIALAHVDLSRVDVDAWVKQITDAGKLCARDLAPFQQTARKWIADLKKAGGKEFYAVFSLADLPGPPFVIAPLTDNADVNGIVALLGSKKAAEPAPQVPFLPGAEVVEKTDQVIFAGSKAAWARIKSGKAAQRPEVAKAFAAAGDAAIQVLILPTADARRVVEELMPTLPKTFGGGPSTILTRGLSWAVVAVKGRPQVEVRLTVQAEDPRAAKQLRDLITKSWQLFNQEIKQDPHVRADLKPLIAQLDNIAAVLTPMVEEDRLTLTVDFQDAAVKNFLLAVGKPLTEKAGRSQNANNLKQLGLALHNYHDTHGSFPAMANYDKEGKPLLSWRVHILPYLDQLGLYKEFHLNEPWDSEHNKRLIARMPGVYRSPNLSPRPEGKTSYLAPVGPAMMFTGGPKGVPIKEVTDGTSNTILLVEAKGERAVVWTKPEDLRIEPEKIVAALRVPHQGRFGLLFADGSVRFESEKLDKKSLFALFTRNGGEVIQPPD